MRRSQSKTTSPSLPITPELVSDAAFSHATSLRSIGFDTEGRLLCTEDDGSWTVWSVPDGVRLAGGEPSTCGVDLQQLDDRTLLGGAHGEGPTQHGLYPLALIDAKTLEFLRPLPLQKGHNAYLLAFNGRLFVVERSEVRVLDASSLEEIARWPLPKALQTRPKLSDGGGLLLGGSHEHCWGVELATGRPISFSTAPWTRSPLAVNDASGDVALLDYTTWTSFTLGSLDSSETRAFRPALRGVISAGVFSADGSRVVVANIDGEVLAYDVAKGEQRWRAALDASVDKLACHPSRPIVAAAAGRRVALLDLNSGALLRSPGHALPPHALSFTSDPPVLCAASDPLSSSSGFTPRLWPLAGAASGPVILQATNARAAGSSVVFLKDALTLAPVAELLASPHAPAPADDPWRVFQAIRTRALALHPNGREVFWCVQQSSGRKRQHVIERTTWADGEWRGAVLASHPKKKPATWLALDGAGSLLIATPEAREVNVYDLATGALAHTLIGIKKLAVRAALSQDGARAAALVLGPQLACWALPDVNPRWIHKLDEAPRDLTFSPNGQRLLTVDARMVSIWDADSGALVDTLVVPRRGGGTAIAFGPDGALYLAADDANLYRFELGASFTALSSAT